MSGVYYTIVKCKHCKRTKSVTCHKDTGDVPMVTAHSMCSCLVVQLREALASVRTAVTV